MRPAAPSVLTISWFDWWCRRALRRSFHRVHLYLESPGEWDASDPAVPRLYVPNHSSFWDGIVLNVLLRHRHGRRAQPLYCMIDEEQVRRHPFFRRIGGFSVDRNDARDGLRAIDYAAGLLNAPTPAAVIVFPQGRFQPNGARPLRFEAGVARLVERVPGLRVVPVALRYEFWEEQGAEAMVRVGAERRFEGLPRAAVMSSILDAVTASLDQLKADGLRQRPGDRLLLKGRRSISRWKERFAGRSADSLPDRGATERPADPPSVPS